MHLELLSLCSGLEVLSLHLLKCLSRALAPVEWNPGFDTGAPGYVLEWDPEDGEKIVGDCERRGTFV